MELYILYLSDALACQTEISKLLQNETTLLIFYDPKEYTLSKLLMDYISLGKIQIRKLPETMEKSSVPIAYEIGELLDKYTDLKIWLWGNELFKRIHTSLLAYEPNLKDRLFFKTIENEKRNNREELKKKPYYSEKAVTEKTIKSENTSLFKEKKNSKKPAKNQVKEEGKPLSKKRIEKEIVTGEFFEQDDDMMFIGIRSEKKETPIQLKESQNETSPEEDQVVKSFQKILETICNESVNRYDTQSILFSVSDAITATTMEYALEIYQKNLMEYLGAQKGEHYFHKTKDNLESILIYFREEISDKK